MKLEREVTKHFSDEKAYGQLKNCARILFEQRKERERDADRWRRLTYATLFRCPHDQKEFALRRDYEAHLEQHHASSQPFESREARHKYVDKQEVSPAIPGGPLSRFEHFLSAARVHM